MTTHAPSQDHHPTLRHEDREAIGAELQDVLVELIDLSLLGKQAHWNLYGPNFRSLHLQLDELVDEWRTASDEVAERAVALGHSPDGQSRTIAERTELGGAAVRSDLRHRRDRRVDRAPHRVDRAHPHAHGPARGRGRGHRRPAPRRGDGAREAGVDHRCSASDGRPGGARRPDRGAGRRGAPALGTVRRRQARRGRSRAPGSGARGARPLLGAAQAPARNRNAGDPPPDVPDPPNDLDGPSWSRRTSSTACTPTSPRRTRTRRRYSVDARRS